MLKFNETGVNNLVKKYKEQIVIALSNPNYSYMEESTRHTSMISECSRGNASAKSYVINLIFENLMEIVSDQDKKRLLEEVNAEVDIFNKKQYETIDLKELGGADQERKITYYQLLELNGSDNQHNKLKEYVNRKDDITLGIEILAEEIFKVEYGIGVINDIYEMKVNNIEVHDIKRIRVEVADGNWYTISDRRVSSSQLVRQYAARLLSQGAGSDLTDDDCERESSLLDGSRLTIALTPASAFETIFIKKFDNFNVTPEDMLANGTVTEELVDLMKLLGKGRTNAVIIGGVNVGKSTFLKMYVGLLPKYLKIGLVDPSKDTDIVALYPDRDIITLFETDSYNMIDQFCKLLRMNRHILGISEARSYEVEQAIKAMVRANSGSFLTLHTTNVKDVVDNIAYMCLESGITQDMRVLRSRIASAVDIVYRIKHFPNGARRVDEVCEVVSTRNLESPFEIRKIFTWDYDKEMVVRNKDYIPSEELLEKMRYYGCSEDEIKRFQQCR